MHLRILLCTFLFLLPAAPGAWSEAPYAFSAQYVDPERGVTRRELLELAEQNNPHLLEAALRIREVAALRQQATLRANPEIQFSAGSSSIAGEPGDSKWSVAYEHPLDLGGKRGRRTTVADLALRIAEAEASNRKREVFSELSRSFAEVLSEAALLEAIEETEHVAAEVHRITGARVAEGEAAAVEKGLTEVEVNRLQAEAATAGGQALAAWTQLKRSAGIHRPELRIRGDLARPSGLETKSIEELVALAKANRPDLRVASYAVEMAQAETALARSEGTSDLRAFIEYTSEESRFDQFGFSANGGVIPIEDSDRIVSAGISLELPLFNRNQGNIQAAQSRAEAARLRKASMEKAVELEVALAYERVRIAKANHEKFRDSILAMARQQTEVLRAAYEAGEIRLFDLLSQQRNLLAIRQSYIAAAREYSLASSELETATATDQGGTE